MEKLKDPAVILGVVNSTAIVGSTVYFYRKQTAIQDELGKMADSLSATIKKVNELQILVGNILEKVNRSDQLQNENRKAQKRTAFDVEEMYSFKDNLLEALKNSGTVDVKNLEPAPRKPSRRQSRSREREREPERRVRYEDEEEEDSHGDNSEEEAERVVQRVRGRRETNH